VSGRINDACERTFVFDNDHPWVGDDAPDVARPAAGVFRSRPARGIARVVCYSPRHDLTLAELPVGELAHLLEVWQQQYRDLEIPLVKQHLSDALWAVKGEGFGAERFDRLTGEARPVHLRASTEKTIAHGFAMVSRFFPGAREELAAIDEEIVHGALGPVVPGKAHYFEDQYISTGGQLYELIAGHDRFVADLRPLLEAHLTPERRS
jgi:hypothetical protein